MFEYFVVGLLFTLLMHVVEPMDGFEFAYRMLLTFLCVIFWPIALIIYIDTILVG